MDITARLDEIRAEAEALRDADPTTEVVAKLKQLLAEKAELTAKLEAEQAIAELTAPVTIAEGDDDAAGDDAGDDTDAGDGEGAEDSDGDEAAPADDDEDADAGEGDAEGEADVETNDPVAEAIAASTVRDQPRAGTGGEEFKPRLVASSNMESLSVGSKMTADTMQRVHRMADSGRYSGRHVFASIARWNGEESVSTRRSSIENTRIMATAKGRSASLITAACFCGPDEAVKEIAACGTDGRPVADLFRSVPVSGRFNYVKPLPLGDVTAGVAIWDCADQDAVDPDDNSTWKPCIDLDCQPEVNVEPYLVPVCGTFTTLQQLSHPELIDEFVRKLAIAHDRIAEQKLLDEIRASSHVFTLNTGQGILSQLVHIIGQLADVTPYGNRLDVSAYTLVVPNGTIEKLVADQHLRGAQDGLRRDTIIAMLSDIGIGSIVEAYEPDTAAAAAYSAATAALPALGVSTAWDPAVNSVGTSPFYLLDPDAYRHGSSELVEAGFIRDAELTRQNRTQYFLEGAEFLEKVNCQPSYVIEITGCPTGTATELGTAPDCD